jgi:hypothetical protein
MLEPVFQTLEKLFLDFTWRRLIQVLFTIILGLAIFVAFERYTSYFQLARLEKATQILERLHQIEADEKLSKEEELQAIHSKLAAELNVTVSTKEISISLDYRFYKFLAGAAPWLLFSFIYVAGFRKRDKTRTVGVIAAIFCGIMFGAIGLLIPDLFWPWLNLIIYPIGHFILVMKLMTGDKDTQKPLARVAKK